MKRLFILIPVLAVILSSCDALDTVPLSEVTTDDYFKNETQLQMFSNTFYSSLLECAFEQQTDIYITITISDELYGGSYRTVPETGGNWTWTVLRKINTLLDNIDRCEDEDAIIKYTAIARFFRAYFYFDKVKYFGDVPWYETQLDSDSEELYKPRDTREYVMTKMLEDVDYAIENLDNDSNCYRIDKWAALALKSRFCLFEGTFRKYHGISYDEHDYNYYLQLSADAASEIMTEGPFKLYSTGNPEEDYMMLFAEVDADTGEYILAIDYDYGLGLRHNATGKTFNMTGKKPGPTRKFINSYLMADGSRFTDKTDWATQTFETEPDDRDPRLSQTIRGHGYHRIGQTAILAPDLGMTCTGYQIIKYVEDPTDADNMVDNDGYSICDLPVMRLAEVYLNYAEAKAEMGTLTQNDLDISVNLLRDRVGMPHMSMAEANGNPDWYLASEEYGYPNVTGSNQGVILEIRRERTIELYDEGFRWWDLMRWKCGNCINQAFTGMYFPGEGAYDLDGDGKVDTALYTTQDDYANDSSVSSYKIDEGIFLSNVTDGYISYYRDVYREGFNEDRDYYYPIPSTDRVLNPNLTQNPGWNDGLNF